MILDGSVAVTGALVSAANQARLLADAMHTVLVLPRGHKVPASRLTDFADVLELPIVPLRKSLTSLAAYPLALMCGSLQLRRILRERYSSRLQLNDFYFLHGALLRIFGFRGRIVTFVRIDPTRFGVAGRLWLAASRWCSTEIVAVSLFIQRRLGAATPSRLVYEQIERLPPTSRQRRVAPTFLFVGNFIEGKGQQDAIAAFNRVAPSHPDARLRFVGGDMGLAKNMRYREQLAALAGSGPAANRIEFCAPTDELSDHHATAVAALNFSVSESFSMTCLEASEAGLPVIATRCGGPEEIILDGATGFLVPVGDIDAMADRMTWVLDHPEKAKAMGEEGRDLVAERFSAKTARAAFSALYALPPAA